MTTTPTTPFGARSNNQEGDPAMTELDHAFSAPPTDEDRLRYRLANLLPVTTGKEHNIDALVAAGVTLSDPPTATTTMTPLEAIAYLHSTLPARPELYEDDEHTSALLALGPLVGGAIPGGRVMAEPTDEDVERLVHLAEQIVHSDVDLAVDYLRSGEVTLAPKPEPEPPKFRYANHEPWHSVHTNDDDHLMAAEFNEGYVPDAQQRAEALRDELNGEKPTHQHCDGDPIECSVQGMQGEWEEANYQRDRLAARVKELEAELHTAAENARYWHEQRNEMLGRAEEAERKLAEAEQWSNSLTMGMDDTWDGDDAQEHIISTYVAEMERRMDAAGVSRERWPDPESLAQVRSDEAQPEATCEELTDCGFDGVKDVCGLAKPCPRHDEAQPAEDRWYVRDGEVMRQDRTGTIYRYRDLLTPDDHAALRRLVESLAQPAEPLFTGHISGHGWERGKDEQLRVEAPAGPDARVHLLLGAEVDVFPHGSRPAPRKVTDVHMLSAFRAVGLLRPGPEEFQELADALNAILAGDTPEG